MNGNFHKKKKPRKCAISEAGLLEIGEMLKTRFYSTGELKKIVAGKYGYTQNIDNVLDFLEARGFLVTEECRFGLKGYHRYFKCMTISEYEKIEEEQRENAKRRILAAVSCGSTF